MDLAPAEEQESSKRQDREWQDRANEKLPVIGAFGQLKVPEAGVQIQPEADPQQNWNYRPVLQATDMDG